MKNLFAFTIVLILLSSCAEDHSEIIPGQDFIPESILAEIRAMGQPIHEGLNPPNVEGRYTISPFILKDSNIPNDFPSGREFGTKNVEFKNFNPKSLKLEVNIEQGNAVGEGYESFISGSGENFTIYVKIEQVEDDGLNTLTTEVFSGTLSPNGIINITNAFFMIDDMGDPQGDMIANGEGRLFVDGDGFSNKVR